MKNSKEIEELIEKIETSKEVLSTMPKNNSKNRDKYINMVNELKNEYSIYRDNIISILKERYEKTINIESNKEIEILKDRLKTINDTLYILNEEKTSYEKLELDKNIYKLSKYYKENLENVNNQILICINKFKEINIEIGLEDFDYTIYVSDYMETFFSEMEKGNVNSDKIKSKFEEIYWKCPEIIIHIELNLRYIYFKKQTIIDKYFEKERNDLLKKWNKTSSEILNVYLDLKKRYIEKKAIDKKMLLDQFISGKLSTKNFSKDKLKSNCLKILPKEIVDQIDENEETGLNILKFLNSLYEYKNYMNFKFIIDDIKKYYNERENYKKSYIEINKKIDVAEKKIKKITKKAVSKGIFGNKKENTNQIVEQSKLIVETKELYKQLDLNKFYNKIAIYLTDNSSVYDVLNLASSYYDYLIKCMIQNNKNITQEEMEEEIQKLQELLKNPYNTIINNITFLEEKDIGLIIKDRYRLLNFNIEKEDITIDNVDNLISILEEIQMGINLNKTDLKIEEIEQLYEIKKLLKIKG